MVYEGDKVPEKEVFRWAQPHYQLQYLQEKHKKQGQNHALFTWSSFLEGLFIQGEHFTVVRNFPGWEMFEGGYFTEVGKFQV